MTILVNSVTTSKHCMERRLQTSVVLEKRSCSKNP